MIRDFINKIKSIINKTRYKNISSSSRISFGVTVYNPSNLVMEEKTNIASGAVIMNTRAKFIMKKYSGSAIGLTVITGNHMSVVGKNHKQITDKDKDKADNPAQFDKDIIVEEDVWLGANATLLYGAKVKRGAIVGANSVVRSTVPPYSIVIGNPAHIVGFRFTPEEIIIHEKNFYDEGERLPIALLEKNYNKYYLSRLKEISDYIRL